MRISVSSFRFILGFSTTALVLGISLCHTAAADWPQWRGPEHNGVSREAELPIEWDASSAMVWRCELPRWGNSTPVISGDAIFLTSHVDDERLLLVKVRKTTGTIEWVRQVGNGTTPRPGKGRRSGSWRGQQKFHSSQNLATPSAVTDGEVVVAHFGNGDLAAYDFDGDRLWRRNLQEDHGRYTIWWGHANSPVLYQDVVISLCIQDSCKGILPDLSPSYIVAHDKKTGDVVWKVERMTGAEAEHGDAYTTPIFRKSGGGTEMVVFGAEVLDAYDPVTGRRLWHMPGLLGNRVITGPVAADGMIYTTRGMRGPLVAVRPRGSGRRPHDEIVWQFDRSTPDSPTPVVWNNLLFMVNDRGITTCLDARTGEMQWQERLEGNYRASPLAAEGRVYFLNMKALTTVVDAGSEFKVLAENQIDDDTIASPVVSDSKMYVRGQRRLYCLGTPATR